MIEPFGTLGDGREVHAVTLGADELRAQILTYGGILRRLTSAGKKRLPCDVVLSLPDLDAYVSDTSFQGIIVGRVANRIARASFELNGQVHRLTANDGANHLHGGREGFGKQLWDVLDVVRSSRLVLGLRSPKGQEGYPGNLDVKAEFVLEGATLRASMEARCDEETPVSLTWHPYFNLAGDARRPASEQHLRIAASRFLPVRDSGMIPSGEAASVDRTPFDFRRLRAIGLRSSHQQLELAGGFDHCFLLDSVRAFDAELHSTESGVTMRVRSNQPGLQFYEGQHLAKTHPGLSGVCLEPQQLPNAVNEPRFPAIMLKPGEVCRAWIEYQFSR